MTATAASTSIARRARGASPRLMLAGLLALAVALLAQTALAAPAQALTGVDLSTYKRVGRYDLPEPTRTVAPSGNLLAQEASGVTYDWDTETLFVVGDGGTSVTQVTKTGALVDTMTLPAGGSPQGTEFYDTEGIAYIGGGEFVMTEERYRQAVRFTYEGGGTLTRAATDTVKLGTTIGNVGLEGLTNDPVSGGYIFVKEMEPRSIFQTGIDWEAGTATNGGPEAVASTDLFDPALTGLIDLSDVYALANVSTLTGPETDNLLIISQESGKVINVDREGNVASSLTLVNDPGNPLSIPAQTHEGVAMDDDGILYTVNEEGGGDSDHPQLWVFEASAEPNQAPSAVSLINATTSLPENTGTSARTKLADVSVEDDGLGENQLGVTGPDAADFEVDSNGLYLKAGTTLDHATKPSYTVSVTVDDPTVGGEPDATSEPFTLEVTAVTGTSTETTVAVTEVSPWSSGNSPYGADWWELTNLGATSIDLTGWKMNDDSDNFGSAVALEGVSSLAPGESAIFIEGSAATAEAFTSFWFGSSVPASFQIGHYSGSGVGLSTGGDAVTVFNAEGDRVTGVAFGSSTDGQTFDNAAALGSALGELPTISTLSVDGANGAFTVSGEVGSPGLAPVPTPVIVSEVAPWGSGNGSYGVDWWELTNNTTTTLDLTGWRMNDDTDAFGSGATLEGVSNLAPGASAIFVEGDASDAEAFTSFWFGSSVPAGFQIGHYSGSGVGLGTGGDAVTVFNTEGDRLTGVAFGAATDGVSFDNAAGLGSFTGLPVLTTLSVEGVNGAFKAHDEIGSPGTIAGAAPLPEVKVTEVSSTSSSNATYGEDWWELTNMGTTAVDLSGWKVDDNSDSFGSAIALSGVTSLAPGESAVFIEGDGATVEAFEAAWFGGSPPSGLQIGTYSGSGIGFSSSGDQVNVFDSEGTPITGVSFGSGTSGFSFDNAAGVGGTEDPPPTISTLSAAGVNGAFEAGGEVGSPGAIENPPAPLPEVKITEVSPTSSSVSAYGEDWWELTNTGSSSVDVSGWRMNDDTDAFGSGVTLNGVSSLAPGESAVFIEGSASTANAFVTAWFGASPPAGFQVGTYSGSGVGLSSGGDQVNVFDSEGTKVTGVDFGSATSGVSFDNAAGIGSAESPPPTISTLSVAGVNGAFEAGGETGSPGTIVTAPSDADCGGSAISGAGTSLQVVAHQGLWTPKFAAIVCPGGPTVSYSAGSETGTLAAWSADGASGSIDTGIEFIGTDIAPTAEQIENIKSAAGGTSVAVIPVAQTAIAILANPPAGCSVDAITNTDLAAAMEGRLKEWSKLETAEGSCDSPITRVVRKDAAGSTYQFKNYLDRLYKKGLFCTTGSTEGRASWAELMPIDATGNPNVEWPESCPEKTLSTVVRPATDGAAATVATVNSTPGSLGYAALPDAEAGVEGSTAILALQNNAQRKGGEANFAEPARGSVANCDGIAYKGPQRGGSLDFDWSQTFGAQPAVGGDHYPLCGLTYVLAFSDYAAAGFSEAAGVTVRDYLHGLVVQAAGQAALNGSYYLPLPSSSNKYFDVIGQARKAANSIGH